MIFKLNSQENEDTEGKYQDTYTNVERPNTKQNRIIEYNTAQSSQNIENNIAEGNHHNERQAAQNQMHKNRNN